MASGAAAGAGGGIRRLELDLGGGGSLAGEGHQVRHAERRCPRTQAVRCLSRAGGQSVRGFTAVTQCDTVSRIMWET